MYMYKALILIPQQQYLNCETSNAKKDNKIRQIFATTGTTPYRWGIDPIVPLHDNHHRVSQIIGITVLD